MVAAPVSRITTHVLDTARGLPAPGIHVTLDVQFPDGAWKSLGREVTDADGRAQNLLPEGAPLTLFALGLTIGWIGHAIEQYTRDEIIRPRARYVGVMP